MRVEEAVHVSYEDEEGREEELTSSRIPTIRD